MDKAFKGLCTDVDGALYDNFHILLPSLSSLQDKEIDVSHCLAYCRNDSVDIDNHVGASYCHKTKLCYCNFGNNAELQIKPAGSVLESGNSGTGPVSEGMSSSHCESSSFRMKCYPHKGYVPPPGTPTALPSVSVEPSISISPSDTPTQSLLPSMTPSFPVNGQYDTANAFEGKCVNSLGELYSGVAFELVITLDECFQLCLGLDNLSQHSGVEFDFNEALCGKYLFIYTAKFYPGSFPYHV